MQIIRATTARAIESGSTPPEDGTPTGIPDPVDSFLTPHTDTAEEPAQPTNAFDLLFSGTPTAPGTDAAPGTPSANDFSPLKVVTLEQFLMAEPKGRYFLEKFITKMETIRDKRYGRALQATKDALAAGGASPQETIAMQKRIAELELSIAKINMEIAKTKTMNEELKTNYAQELVHSSDLNGDGYVGDPSDKAHSYIVGHPKLANGEPDLSQIVLLTNSDDPQAAVAPFMDKNYLPALASTDNLKFAETPAPTGSRFQALQLNGSRHITGQGYPESFGAQIDITAAEGFWVEVDPATGEPIVERDHGSKYYKPKKLEVVTREDGKRMIGQNPPVTEEEKSKYKFIRVTDLNIKSEDVNPDDATIGGNVFYNFKDKDGKVIMSLRIEGINVTGAGNMSGNGSYIAATSVGIAVNAGEGEHSSSVSPKTVDATGFESTGKVLPAREDRPAEIDNFYEAMGIDAAHTSNGYLTGVNPGKGYEVRGVAAANDTLQYGFLDPNPNPLKVHYNVGDDGNKALNNAKEAGAEIGRKFGVGEHGPATTAIFLAFNDKKYNDFKTGVAVTGIRGVIKGTDYNDIVVVPPPDDEKIKKLLAFGAADIDPSNPAYGTVVEGGGGRNIVVSKGGDLFASGVSFLWRESERDGENIFIDTNNGVEPTKSDPGALPVNNQGTFIHIGDTSPADVRINNKSDDSSEPSVNGADNVDGNPDDWYDVPNTTLFSNTTEFNDLPANITDNNDEHASSAVDIKTAIDAAATVLRDKVIHHDPATAYEGVERIDWGVYGKAYDDWAKASDSFFTEWEFFHPQDGEAE